MRFLSLAVVATMACSAPDTPVVAQQPGRVQAPAGVSLILPSGWQAGERDATHLQLLPTNAANGEAVVIASASANGATSLTDPAVIRTTEQELRQLFPVLRRVGEPKLIRTGLGDGVRLDWEGTPPGGEPMRLSVHLALHEGQVVSIMAAGPRAQVRARESVLEAAFASFAPSVATAPAETPKRTNPGAGTDALSDGSAAARDWLGRLRGKKLTLLSGYNSGGGGGGMTSRSDLVLSPDGRFSYFSSSSVSMSVDGMDGSSSGTNSARGRWSLAGRGGGAMLVLVHDEGGREEIRLERDGTKTFLDGRRAYVTDP